MQQNNFQQNIIGRTMPISILMYNINIFYIMLYGWYTIETKFISSYWREKLWAEKQTTSKLENYEMTLRVYNICLEKKSNKAVLSKY